MTSKQRLSFEYGRGLAPPRNLNVVQWAERYRVLSRESSRGGRFVMARREIARGPMLAATERGVRRLTACVCTQLFKTTLMECVIGHRIDVDPCPILVVYPDEKAAKMFSTERLAPMIRDTAPLRAIMSSKSRDAANSWDTKAFPGGLINMATARSAMDLSARPIGLLVCDEMGRFPESAGKEGDPIFIAEERQAEYEGVALSVRCGSPTVAGHCPIEASYLESDQRKAFVACPKCKVFQTLEWENVKGPDQKAFEKTASGSIRAETSKLYCVECAHPWSEADRLLSFRDIRWRQTKVFDCCNRRQQPEHWDANGRALCAICTRQAVSNEHAGFTASKLYAPNQTVVQLVKKFAAAIRKGANTLKAFFNTQLARTWKEDAEAPEWQAVFNKRDRYPSRTVPLPGLILWAGVDMQKDRAEAVICAFGRNRQRYFIEHRVFPGAVHRPEVWDSLRKFIIESSWPHASGAEMTVRDWGIDSGAFTAEVYAFVRSMAGVARVHAIDGQDSYSGAFVGVGNKEIDSAGKKIRRGLATVKVGVSFCKQELLGAFALERPSPGQEYPPGFVHLPDDITEDEVKQLTSEELRTATERGRTKREWNLITGRRNEVLDCINYARGLAAMGGWERMREKHFRQIEESMGIERGGNAVETDNVTVRSEDRPPETISQRALKTVKPKRRPTGRPGIMMR